MKDKNWSYLAGLFDGEGCAHIAKVNYHGSGTAHSEFGYRLDIHITMCNLEVIKWLVKHFGGVYYVKPSTNPKWNVAYRWVPKGKKNKEELLLGILPYLIVKRRIVELSLEFLRLMGICPEVREQFFQKAHLLTKRGKSVEANTLDLDESQEKIESDLISDYECAPLVTVDA